MVVIRPYKRGDEKGMCEAHITAVRGICNKDYSSLQINLWLEGRAPAEYVAFKRQQKERFWVAEDAGRIVGFGGWHGTEIGHLYMCPDYAGKGYGRKLYEVIERDYFARSGNPVCRITSTITAKSFYEHMGAKPVSLGLQTLHDGKTVVSAWHMQKPMPQSMVVHQRPAAS
jgi:GNAT superfamily N-acetyltransferase